LYSSCGAKQIVISKIGRKKRIVGKKNRWEKKQNRLVRGESRNLQGEGHKHAMVVGGAR